MLRGLNETIIGYTTNPAGVANQYDTLAKDKAAAFPCGLIAKSMFNDTYKLTDSKGNKIDIKENNIAWSGDQGLYKNANLSKQWIDVTNGIIIVF